MSGYSQRPKIYYFMLDAQKKGKVLLSHSFTKMLSQPDHFLSAMFKPRREWNGGAYCHKYFTRINV